MRKGRACCAKRPLDAAAMHFSALLPQISKKWTHWGATLLFLFFGARMLYEAITNAHAGDNELEEVEKELQVGKASEGIFCHVERQQYAAAAAAAAMPPLP